MSYYLLNIILLIKDYLHFINSDLVFDIISLIDKDTGKNPNILFPINEVTNVINVKFLNISQDLNP